MSKVKTTAAEKNVLRWMRMGIRPKWNRSHRNEATLIDPNGEGFDHVKRKVLVNLEEKGLVTLDNAMEWWIFTPDGETEAKKLD